MATVHDSFYRITISRESQFNGCGDSWVARDESGTWRSFCQAEFSNDARLAAEGMFHAGEIFDIEGDSENATAKVRTYIQSNGGVQ